jgi:hypothetical protein
MNVLVSFIALAISLASFAFSVFNWRERKLQDQRDLYLKIHERLVDIDLQHGRRIIYRDVQSAEQAKDLFRERPEDYDLANRALAMLDVATLYEEQRYIDGKLFMREWGPVYARIRENSGYFIAERIAHSAAPVHPVWPHFQSLARRASDLSQTENRQAAEGRLAGVPNDLLGVNERQEGQ